METYGGLTIDTLVDCSQPSIFSYFSSIVSSLKTNRVRAGSEQRTRGWGCFFLFPPQPALLVLTMFACARFARKGERPLTVWRPRGWWRLLCFILEQDSRLSHFRCLLTEYALVLISFRKVNKMIARGAAMEQYRHLGQGRAVLLVTSGMRLYSI